MSKPACANCRNFNKGYYTLPCTICIDANEYKPVLKLRSVARVRRTKELEDKMRLIMRESTDLRIVDIAKEALGL